MNKLSHKPDGFARYLKVTKKYFNDGQVKDASRHGYIRSINTDGSYAISVN
jgi:hypothetical protein